MVGDGSDEGGGGDGGGDGGDDDGGGRHRLKAGYGDVTIVVFWDWPINKTSAKEGTIGFLAANRIV